MQTRGTFPELNSGRKKSASKRANSSGKFRKEDAGGFTGGFSVPGRVRPGNTAPKTLAGRRLASHAAARRGNR